MTDIKSAMESWEEVSESFAALGRRLNEHFEAAAAAGEHTDLSQIEEALETVGEALERAVGAVGDSLRDVQAYAEATRAVVCLSSAVEASFGGVGQELRGAFRDRVAAATG